MPVLRYFLYVGGTLLSLILISSAVLPLIPLPSTLTSGSDLPTVRIHTDRKLPERGVFDTSSTVSSAAIPVIAATKVAWTAAPVAESVATVPPTPNPEISPKARVREAFAQLPADEDVSKPKMSDSALVTAAGPKLVAKAPPKRKVAKPRTAPPLLMVAQQPRFGQTAW